MTEPTVTQGDSVTFVMRVTDNGAGVDLGDYTSYTLTSVRPDGLAVLVNGIEIGNSQVEFKLGTLELDKVGTVSASIQLYEGGRVSSIPFTYKVLKDLSDEYVPTENDLTLIELVLGQGPGLLDATVQATEKANTATGKANTASANATTSGDYASEQGDYAKSQGNYAKGEGDYANGQGDFANTEGTRAKNEADRLEGVDVAVLDQKVDDNHAEVTQHLAKKANQSEVASFYYKPTEKMPAIDGSDVINAETIKSADVYALYQTLKSNHSSYIKSVLVGNDQSDTLPIYWYYFEPKTYEKEIVIDANLHGGGETGDPKDVAIAVYLFLKDVCENWDKSKELFELRWNTRIIVIPIVNPWGFDNDSRQNSRGVDINRNFDWKWGEYPTRNPFEHDYKGTAPFSEQETKYIKSLLEDVSNTASAYINFHAFGSGSVRDFAYPFYISAGSPLAKPINQVADYLGEMYGAGKTVVTNSDMPSGYNYAERILNIPAITPEYVVYTTNYETRTSSAITRMVEYYGNIIIMSLGNLVDDRFFSSVQSTKGMSLNASNTVLKDFNEVATNRTFSFDKSTGEFKVPEGVKLVKIKAQVYFFYNKSQPEWIKISSFIQKNGQRIQGGYPVTSEVCYLGGTQASFKSHIIHLSSPTLVVSASDKFKLTVDSSDVSGELTTYPQNLEGTWFSIEEVRL